MLGPEPSRLRLAELLSALSYALDLTEGQPPGHCVRACWIGLHIGREIGLDGASLSDLYYTLLLKDLGCSSNAARICELYLTDDLTFKRDFKEVGSSLPEVLRFVISHTGVGTGLAERVRTLVNVVQNGGEFARDLIETRCLRGATIARQMRFSARVADGIQSLDEHWNGGGKPLGLSGKAIPVASRIALLAQVVDVFHNAVGPKATLQEVRKRAGTWFDPALVLALERVAEEPGFWAKLHAQDIEQAIFALEPAQATATIDEDYLDDIVTAFAQVVDAKSPYTHGHSERVAQFTDLIARELGLAADHRRWLKRAALLHDIGKLGISNTLLDKPQRLEPQEFATVQRHASLGEGILTRVKALADIAPVAGAHHERLDGGGYPRGLKGDEITLDTRILTVADIFDALTADRPYRAALSVETALGIMARDVGTAIDAHCFDALTAAVTRSTAPTH